MSQMNRENQMTFDEFATQLFALYDAGEYDKLYELTRREVGNFPEQAQDTLFWYACAASLTGHTDEALQTLENWSAQGHWVAEQRFRDEPDLKPLDGMSRYEAVIAVSRERHEKIEAETGPKLLTLLPEQQATTYPLLIALHGNNGNAQRTAPHWQPIVKRGWILAVPQSSQIYMPESYIWNDREKATREVLAHYTALTGEYPVDKDDVILGGFSMGAGLSIRLSMSGAINARGFIAVGPYVPDVDSLTPFLEQSKARGLRGVILVGERDKHCYDNSLKIAEMLNAHGIACDLTVYPDLAHDYPPDFLQKLVEAVAFVEG